jgi:hypothetical protein
LDEATSFSQLNLPSCRRVFPYVDKKYTTGKKELLFQASVFLTSTNHANTPTGWQQPQRDHINSLYVHKEINSL